MRSAVLLSLAVLAGCAGAMRGESFESRYTTAGASDEPSHGSVVLAGGAVAYDLTAWHLADGTHLDATITNRGPGVLRVEPSRATLATAAGEPVAATPAGCGRCAPGSACPEASAAAAAREIPAGESRRVVRCFAPVNPWSGRHAISGADPKRLALTFRDEGLTLDGAPLVAVVELTRQ